MDEVTFRRPALRYAYGLRFFILSKTAACNNGAGGYDRKTKNPQKTSFNALRTFKSSLRFGQVGLMDEVLFRRPALRYAYGLRFFILSKTAACNNGAGGYDRKTKNPQKTSFNALRTFKSSLRFGQVGLMDEVLFRRPALRYAYGLRFFILSKTAACNNGAGGYDRKTKNPQKTSFNALRTFKSSLRFVERV